jgi:N-acetylmuramoyl-L-alanine amidase
MILQRTAPLLDRLTITGRFWRVIFTLAFLVLGTAGATRSEPVAWISDVRLGQHQDHTRVVMRLNKSIDFEVFTLADPYRVVVDFPQIGWRMDPKAASPSLGLVKGYRYGSYKPGTSRMVIDLSGPVVLANKFLLPPDAKSPEYRLVLDFAPTDRASYLTAAGWKGEAEQPEAEPDIRTTDPSEARGSIPVIVIDPGHGGVDPGATGVTGTLEKDVVLGVAQSLAAELRKSGRYKVVMTRDSDIFLSLKARVALGRKSRADLFVSIHADAAPASGARGASVYTLSEQASDREAEALASAENQSDIIAGVDLSKEPDIVTSILIDLAQRETKNRSAKFAQILIPELHKVGSLTHRTHRFAGFRVLKAPDVPSVLIELGYLTNVEDESAMRGSRWRKGMAKAIAQAVDGYFRQGPRGRNPDLASGKVE